MRKKFRRFLLFLLAVIFIIEAWLWDMTGRVVSYVVAHLPFERLKQAIAYRKGRDGSEIADGRRRLVRRPAVLPVRAIEAAPPKEWPMTATFDTSMPPRSRGDSPSGCASWSITKRTSATLTACWRTM